jgi:hypothetical protein
MTEAMPPAARAKPLRWRVTFATTALGALLSLLFAGAAVFIAEDYEAILIDEILGSQAQDYSLALAADPRAPLPRSHRLSGYLRRGDGSGDVPPALRPLPPGVHDDEDGLPEGMTVGVYDIAQGRLYFVIDLGDIEVLEQHLAWFLVAIVVSGTALAAWLGWFLAGVSLAPLRRLAAAVDALPTRPQPTQLAQVTGADELGRLAHAIDAYQARLVDADAEERRFFADASHELRTPLAVMRGAAELMLDETASPDEQRSWRARFERGMDELTLLLEVLLGLGRGDELLPEPETFENLVHAAIVAAGLDGRFVVTMEQSLHAWRVPRREAGLLLQDLLRRLASGVPTGALWAHATPGELVFTLVPSSAVAPGADARGAAWARGEAASGRTLVVRLAQRMGWRIALREETDGMRIAQVAFDAAT